MTDAAPPTPLPGWTPRPRPHRKVLEGQYARVEPLDAERHCDDLFAAFSADPTHKRWTYRFQSGFDTRQQLFDYLVSIETNAAAHFGAYIDLTTGKAGGLGSLMSIEPNYGTIEIGAIMLSPAMSGTRAGTEALILQMRWVFEMGYRRIEWTCDPVNDASIRAAQRLGFAYEATFRQRYASKGRNRDQAIFAVLDREWAAIDAQQRAWLEPSNFDAAGRQKANLRELTAPLLAARAPSANWQPTAHRNAAGQPIGPPLPAGWAPPPKPARETLTGAAVTCTPLVVEHAPQLYRAFADVGDEHWAWLPYGPFASERAFTEWVRASTLTSDPLFHAVIVGGEAVGFVSFLRIFDPDGCIEIGQLCFGRALKRSRAATEALYLLLDWAFAHGYRRVEWKCNNSNAASKRAAQRLGFVAEGVLRQHRIVKGCNRDSAWFSIVDSEWPLVRAALVAWLAPSNFDASGKQRRRLEECHAELQPRQKRARE